MGIVMCGVPLLSLVLLTEKYITAAVTRYQLAGEWTNDSHVYRYILIYQVNSEYLWEMVCGDIGWQPVKSYFLSTLLGRQRPEYAGI